MIKKFIITINVFKNNFSFQLMIPGSFFILLLPLILWCRIIKFYKVFAIIFVHTIWSPIIPLNLYRNQNIIILIFRFIKKNWFLSWRLLLLIKMWCNWIQITNHKWNLFFVSFSDFSSIGIDLALEYSQYLRGRGSPRKGLISPYLLRKSTVVFSCLIWINFNSSISIVTKSQFYFSKFFKCSTIWTPSSSNCDLSLILNGSFSLMKKFHGYNW